MSKRALLRLAALALIGAMVAGCGNKGPLVRPPAPAPAGSASSATP